MRRLDVGCTTDAHPIYPTFMGCLSACLFEWDAGDLNLLRQAKKQQLMQEGMPAITDLLVDRSISKRDLSLYCRRRTRSEEDTIRLIERLLQELGGTNGRDLMGVPLLDQVRMEHVWRVQKRHVKCMVGTTKKAGVLLTRYCCASVSTALESFHCHLNRNQCQCTEFPALPPGRPEQVESGSGDCSSDQQASVPPHLLRGYGPLRQHQQPESVWPGFCANFQVTCQIHWRAAWC